MTQTPKSQHEFFYMYDKKIKRRCVHVIVEGYAVSLISGTRSKIPIFDEDKIREEAKSQTELELKRDFLIRLQNINNSPTDGDCVLKLCYEIEKTRAEIKKLEGKKNA